MKDWFRFPIRNRFPSLKVGTEFSYKFRPYPILEEVLMADIYGTPESTGSYVNCPRCCDRVRCDLLERHLRTCEGKEAM